MASSAPDDHAPATAGTHAHPDPHTGGAASEHSPASGAPASDAGGAGGPAAGGAESAAPDPLAAAHEQVADLEDRLRRAVADTDNLRKRHARERDRERLADRMRAAEAWLPVLDNLELALQHAGDSEDPFVQGVRAVFDQGLETMSRLGFPRFEAEGATFDPALHEAVSSYPDAAQAGTVLAVTRPGYGTAEALLRPAQVVVAVAP